MNSSSMKHFIKKTQYPSGDHGNVAGQAGSDITDFEEVLALDLEYINNWSLGLDMKILLKTVFGVFGGKGAK